MRTYTVEKGSEVIGGEITAGSSADVPASRVDFEPVWVVPDGWRAVEEERAMRLATYVMPGPGGDVEVAITRFPGDVGGMLANVNRWRGQIGLEPVMEDELEGMLERFENPGFVGHLLHLQGPEQEMLAASIFETAQDRTWFVRVIADAETVEQVKPAVFDFARTFGLSEAN